MPTRSASMSGRARPASVTAMMSANGRSPQSRCPRAMNCQAVSGGQRRVGQQHRVAAGGHQPRIPPPGPGIPAAHRAAVHPQQQRRRAVGRRRGRAARARPGSAGRRRRSPRTSSSRPGHRQRHARALPARTGSARPRPDRCGPGWAASPPPTAARTGTGRPGRVQVGIRAVVAGHAGDLAGLQCRRGTPAACRRHRRRSTRRGNRATRPARRATGRGRAAGRAPPRRPRPSRQSEPPSRRQRCQRPGRASAARSVGARWRLAHGRRSTGRRARPAGCSKSNSGAAEQHPPLAAGHVDHDQLAMRLARGVPLPPAGERPRCRPGSARTPPRPAPGPAPGSGPAARRTARLVPASPRPCSESFRLPQPCPGRRRTAWAGPVPGRDPST